MKTRSFTVAALVSGLIASLCCIGPAAAALFGIGTLGWLSALEMFRPYLIPLSLGFVAFAFYLSHRARKNCRDATCTTDPTRSPRGVWIGGILTIALLAFPFLPLPGNSEVISKATVIDVEGMTCGGCEKLVESVVGKLEGVTAVRANSSEGNVHVSFDSARVNVSSIVESINRETAYKAHIHEP